MPRLSNGLTLAATPTAVKLSRSLVAVTLRYWGLRRMADDAELVVSELTTNAVKATGVIDPEPTWSERANLPLIRVRVVHLLASIAIEVWDADPTPPKPTDAGPGAESGRGLAIIEALCDRWDYWRAIGGGKVIWAELAIPPLPVTDARPLIRMPEPGQLGPIPLAIDHNLWALRRVQHGLRNLNLSSLSDVGSSRDVDLYVKNRQLREQSELLRQQAEASTGGLLGELSRRLSAIEASAAGLASVPTVKTDAALADGLVQLDRSIGRLRDTLDALGADD